MARFERPADDATVFVGPKNNDVLHLRTCTDAWTVEAWVRYTGPGGENRSGNTAVQICGAGDDEGFGLNGIRGGWYLGLSSSEGGGTLSDGIAPCARFQVGLGKPPLRDPHHDTSGHMWPTEPLWQGVPKSRFIRDTEWHHVAWQYRAAGDLHELFLDSRPIWRMRSPDGRRLVNNRRHEAQFSVFSRINGYVIRGHGEDGAFSNHFNYRGWGNFFGQIGEIRVSHVRRYGTI